MPPKPQLKLGPSAFSAPVAPPRRTTPAELVDAHVHLWTSREIKVMTWNKQLSEGNPLQEEHDIERYSETVHRYRQGKAPSMAGFVYVQIEVDAGENAWTNAVNEVDAVLHAASTTAADDGRPRLLALVPWAPVTAGAQRLEDYIRKLFSLPSLLSFATSTLPPERQNDISPAGAAKAIIKGVRFLVEAAPLGTVLEDDFIESLRFLGTRNLVFEFCVHTAQQGVKVLDEVLECIARVRDGQQGRLTRFVLDHLCKPDIRAAAASSVYTRAPSYSDFTARIFEFALLPDVSIKLSGLLSLADPQVAQSAFAEWLGRTRDKSGEGYKAPLPGIGQYDLLKKAIQIFVEPVLDSFGHERIMIGSDFPMYRAVLFPTDLITKVSPALEWAGYEFAIALYLDVLLELGLGGDELDAIFAGNAKRIYGVPAATA